MFLNLSWHIASFLAAGGLVEPSVASVQGLGTSCRCWKTLLSYGLSLQNQVRWNLQRVVGWHRAGLHGHGTMGWRAEGSLPIACLFPWVGRAIPSLPSSRKKRGAAGTAHIWDCRWWDDKRAKPFQLFCGSTGAARRLFQRVAACHSCVCFAGTAVRIFLVPRR